MGTLLQRATRRLPRVEPEQQQQLQAHLVRQHRSRDRRRRRRRRSSCRMYTLPGMVLAPAGRLGLLKQ
jgi:hypothetical protein